MTQRNEKTQYCFWCIIFYTFYQEVYFSAWWRLFFMLNSNLLLNFNWRGVSHMH